MQAIRASFVFSLGLLLILGCSDKDTPAPLMSVGPGVFFVSTNGNDAWSGRFPTPRPDGTDGPLRSPECAMEAARAYRDGWPVRKKSAIVLRQGTYFLNAPLRLHPGDSGLLISSYPGEKAILSGGRRIVNWREEQRGLQRLWIAEVPGWSFRQLWVNGERAVRARTPNRGYYPVLAIPERTEGWHQGHRSFGYMANHLTNSPTMSQAEIIVMTRWTASRLPISAINEDERTVYLKKRSVFALSPGDLYYVEGNLESLDRAGEWFLDQESGRLSYMPKPGEDLRTAEIIAPVLPQLFIVEGKASERNLVRGLKLCSLTFSHTEWYFPPGFSKARVGLWPEPTEDTGGFAQSAAGVLGAFAAEGLAEAIVIGCSFRNLGGYGMELGRGCKGNRIISSEFSDLGAGGLKIGTTSLPVHVADIAGWNVVSNCHVFNGGRLFHEASAVLIRQSPANVVANNHIHDFYYSGISAGWTWGYGVSLTTNTVIAYNRVHHLGAPLNGDGPILSDMGAIYTLGNHSGSIIANNILHDISANRYGGWGIYFDEGTTSIIARSNIVYSTTHGGFHQHYGASNLVANNVFAFAKIDQIQRTRLEPHVAFSFVTNIVYYDEGYLLGGYFEDDRFVMNRNIYCDARNVTNNDVGPCNWDEWQARGHDTNSLRADPLFVAPVERDFRLKPGSPALKMGFQPIDVRRVGIHP